MICHTHATGGNRTTRDTDDDDDDEEDDEEEDGARLRGHATSTPCARMRPADSPSAHQQPHQQRGRQIFASGVQTSRSAESKRESHIRLLASALLSRVEETTTEEVPRRDRRVPRSDLRVRRSSAESTTTTVRLRRRRRNDPVALAFPEALAFPRRGAVVRSTGVG